MITEDVLKKLLISFFAVAVFVGAALVTVVIMSSCVEADNPFLEVTKIIPREVPPEPPPPPPPPVDADPELPRITEHPRNASYTIDTAALALTVSAEVDDNGSLSCQWYRSDTDISDTDIYEGTILEGATEWRYTPPAVSLGVTYYYAIITNTLNEKTAAAASNTARIEIHNRQVTDIEIAAQPSQLAYTHGDALDLTGLTLKLLYNNGTSENIPSADFAARGISTSPAHGETLVFVTYNGVTVAVFFAGFTAETQPLTVNRAIPAITFPTAAALTYGAPLSDSALSGGSIEAGGFRWAQDYTIPEVRNAGYDVEFTPFDTENYDYTGLTGWNDITGRLVRRVAITVHPAIISDADVTVYGPVTGQAPSGWASVLGYIYVNGETKWEPNDSTFLGSQAYTATVTLWADTNYIFTDQMVGMINGNEAEITAIITNENGTQVTLAYTFTPTNDRNIKGFTLRQPPNRSLTYTHNDRLNLTGLTTMFTYDDGTFDYAYPADSATARGVTVNYAHNLLLSCVTHNGQPLTVSYVDSSLPTPIDITITVGILTVNKLAGAAVTKPTLVSTTATSITINASTLISPVGEQQSIEYAASTTAPNAQGVLEHPENLIWVVPDSLEFTNLLANMTYYIYARSKEDATHYAGTKIEYIVVPLQAFTINIEQITDGRNLNLTFTDSDGNPMNAIILYRSREPHIAIITITYVTTNYVGIYWYCNGTQIGSGRTLTLDVIDGQYSNVYGWPGRKYITVVDTRTGYVPTSRRFELITYN